MTDCPACTAKRLHEPSDWALHPYAGHGFNGQVWTYPGGISVSAAPLTKADVQSAQKLLKEHPEYAVPQQTVGRTPEWREKLGYKP